MDVKRRIRENETEKSVERPLVSLVPTVPSSKSSIHECRCAGRGLTLHWMKELEQKLSSLTRPASRRNSSGRPPFPRHVIALLRLSTVLQLSFFARSCLPELPFHPLQLFDFVLCQLSLVPSRNRRRRPPFLLTPSSRRRQVLVLSLSPLLLPLSLFHQPTY